MKRNKHLKTITDIIYPAFALFAFACFALSPSAGISATAEGRQLFVLATDSNSVTVIDSDSDQIMTNIPVGQNPVRLAMTPDGLKAYVSNTGSDTVSVINTLNRSLTTTISTGYPGPQEITVTPDGGRVFVVHQYSGYVSAIDTATDTLITNVAIPGNEAKDVLATPDGRFVYVANYSASEVSVIDTSTYLVSNIATPAGPRRLAITPGGDRILRPTSGNCLRHRHSHPDCDRDHPRWDESQRHRHHTGRQRNLCDERRRRHCLGY